MKKLQGNVIWAAGTVGTIHKSVVALAVLGALVGGAVTGHAGFLVHRNDALWDATYEGDVDPLSSSPVWTEAHNGGPGGSTDGDLWTVNTDDGKYAIWAQSGTTWSTLGSQRMIEFRVRVDSQTDPDYAVQMYMSPLSSGRTWIANLHTNSVEVAGSSALIDNSVFHTYRMTIDSSLGVDRGKLYVDGNTTPILTSDGAVGNPNGDILFFGDSNLTADGIHSGGISKWDFVSWTGYIVPEPSSCLLFGLGAMGLLAKRRRRA